MLFIMFHKKLSFDVSGGGKLMYSLVADLGCVECVSQSVLHTTGLCVRSTPTCLLLAIGVHTSPLLTDNLDVVKGLHLFLGIIVMLLCVASFTLTLKAVRKSFRLAKVWAPHRSGRSSHTCIICIHSFL